MLLPGCGQNMAVQHDLCPEYRLITIAPEDKLTPHTAYSIMHDDDQYEAICHR